MTAIFKKVVVHSTDFNVAELQKELVKNAGVGAIASFTGYVRSTSIDNTNTQCEVQGMELEHYPGMTEQSIETIIDQAEKRWSLVAATVVHRIGKLAPAEQIVYVGVSSAHRGDAFAACEFIMDFLKTRAPFWKREQSGDSFHWVEARDSDEKAAQRWQD